MQKRRAYDGVRFAPEVLRSAREAFESILNEDKIVWAMQDRAVSIDDVETWDFDTDEEFFAALRSGYESSSFALSPLNDPCVMRVEMDPGRAVVSVRAPTRPEIESIFELFEEAVPQSRLPESPDVPEEKVSPRVFIGHGRDAQWRDLKDHLQDQHGYQVEAYEVGARAGHTIRDILDEMMQRSDIAFLVMTAEDETANGELRARQNVVHELGLFQGKLGFTRAIAVLEKGTDGFSNLQGIQQIRFEKGRIRETFGDVLAVLGREFGA